jgi:hypothetical protein
MVEKKVHPLRTNKPAIMRKANESRKQLGLTFMSRWVAEGGYGRSQRHLKK